MLVYTMKTGKSHRILVAPSVLIYFSWTRKKGSPVPHAEAIPTLDKKSFPLVFPELYLSLCPSNSLAAWIILWFICTYLSTFLLCHCQTMPSQSKCLLLPQIAWPPSHTLRFHATQFTPQGAHGLPGWYFDPPLYWPHLVLSHHKFHLHTIAFCAKNH